MSLKRHLFLCLLSLTAGCQQLPEHSGQADCGASGLVVSGGYPGARLGSCQRVDRSTIRLVNSPEDEPINASPWYGFRVDGPATNQQFKVEIEYALHKHRYQPKISYDQLSWTPLSAERVKISEDGRIAAISLQVDRTPLWVSAQENLDNAWYARWRERLLQTYPQLSERVIGQSIEGRAIHLLESRTEAQNVLLIVGRQHPPEVTGALAQQAFVEYLYEHMDDDCAQRVCQFMRDTHVLLVPNMNPDGVDLGHWRHGLGHLDLNRDWGPFTQPETQAVKGVIDRLTAQGKTFLLFLDFHSTARNLFYTQSEAEEQVHDRFATRWLKRAEKQGVYPFAQERRQNVGLPTSKNYMYERFGIPAITYEVGDETPRDEIRASAQVFADAMIGTLAATP